LQGIYGFGENNIFVVGTYGSYGYAAIWNGSIWNETNFFRYFPNGDTVWGLKGVWGSTPEDVWAVGDQGTIIHWDGSEWRKISASITTPVTDVCGVSQSEVYLIAYDNISSGTSAVFKFNGFAWEKISTIGIFNYGGETIWKTPAGKLFAGGKTLLEFTGNSYEEIFTEGRSRYIIKIGGSNTNNIFTVGTFGEITHFNGVSWINLDDFEVPDGRYRVLYSVWCTENKVFIVGVDENRAIIITGIIN
jgi:hypothetical protein